MFYDVIVLGAGPGGYVSAIRAAQLGAKVAVIEQRWVGGTCLNSGCIPTKALIKNVEIMHSIEIGEDRGIQVGEIKLDYKKAVKVKNKAVRQLVNGVKGLLDSNGVTLYQGKGIVLPEKMIDIVGPDSQSERVQYGKLIIATGSKPSLPPIKGIDLEKVMTSEEILQIEYIPENLLVVGGGVIGCEFASIFHAYGSKVTIVEAMPSLVAMLDSDISDYMNQMICHKGIDVRLGTQVHEISKKDDGTLNVVTENGEGNSQELSADLVLISIGRKPNTEGLEQLNLETDRGAIQIGAYSNTSVPDVYAIGDVTGKKLLAHVASEMGILAAENAMGHQKPINLDIVPSCIYTIPEIGSVGLSEQEANRLGKDVLIGKFPLAACGKAIATGEPEGLFKIIADKQSRKILGAHLIGKSATELIAEMGAYMKMGSTVDDVVDTIHAHPTISESIAEAARDVDGSTIHMPKRK